MQDIRGNRGPGTVKFENRTDLFNVLHDTAKGFVIPDGLQEMAWRKGWVVAVCLRKRHFEHLRQRAAVDRNEGQGVHGESLTSKLNGIGEEEPGMCKAADQSCEQGLVGLQEVVLQRFSPSSEPSRLILEKVHEISFVSRAC